MNAQLDYLIVMQFNDKGMCYKPLLLASLSYYWYYCLCISNAADILFSTGVIISGVREAEANLA